MHIDYVKTPFNNNPSMQKYSGPLLIENPRKIYLDEKLTQLSEYGDDLYGESKIFKENNLFSFFAFAKVSSFHGCQSTGLCAC